MERQHKYIDCGLDEERWTIAGCPRGAVQYPFESACIQTDTESHWVMNWEHTRGGSIFLSCCSAAADHVVACCWCTTGQNWANTKHKWKFRFLNASKYFLLLLDWVGFPFFCVLTTVTVSERNPWRSVNSQLCEFFLLVFLCGSPCESQMHKISFIL